MRVDDIRGYGQLVRGWSFCADSDNQNMFTDRDGFGVSNISRVGVSMREDGK